MKRNISLYLLLTLTLLICPQCTTRSPEEAAIDEAAPPFQLKDLQGHEVSLSQYKGKIVILDFWATWCGPCRMSMPLLEQLQRDNPNDFTLLAINLEEPPDLVRDYVSRQNIRSRVLLDSEGKVGRTYRSDSIPMQVVIDKKGIVRHIQMGFSPRLGTELKREIDKLRNN